VLATNTVLVLPAALARVIRALAAVQEAALTRDLAPPKIPFDDLPAIPY